MKFRAVEYNATYKVSDTTGLTKEYYSIGDVIYTWSNSGGLYKRDSGLLCMITYIGDDKIQLIVINGDSGNRLCDAISYSGNIKKIPHDVIERMILDIKDWSACDAEILMTEVTNES
jgi:hypothetical protein